MSGCRSSSPILRRFSCPRRLTPLQIGLLAVLQASPSSTSPAPCRCSPAVPGAKVHLIWKRIEPVPSDSVLALTPTTTFADCPQLDVHLRARRLRHRRHDQRRGGAGLPAQAGRGCQIHHLGLHGIAGAGRRRPAARAIVPRRTGAAMDIACPASARRRRRRGSASTATASPAAASPRGIDFALTLVSLLRRPQDGGSDPARARIQSGTAVRLRFARHRAGRKYWPCMKERSAERRPAASKRSSARPNGSCRTLAHDTPARPGRGAACNAAPPSRDQVSVRLSAAAQRRCSASGTREKFRQTPKEKGRLVSQSGLSCLTAAAHFIGRFRNFQHRGPISRPSPGRRAAAFRDSRELEPDTDAMVSHLRKMAPLSRDRSHERNKRADGCPRCSRCPQGRRCGCESRHPTRSDRKMRSCASLAGRPGLVVAGRLGAACRWPASSRRADRRSACRSDSAGAAFPIRAAV